MTDTYIPGAVDTDGRRRHKRRRHLKVSYFFFLAIAAVIVTKLDPDSLHLYSFGALGLLAGSLWPRSAHAFGETSRFVPAVAQHGGAWDARLSGLRRLTYELQRRTSVEVITDSKYVAQGCEEWLPGWKKNGWRRREGKSWKPVKNLELWQTLDALLAKHEVRFTWIRGHAGHAENERCDELAVAAALRAATCDRPSDSDE